MLKRVASGVPATGAQAAMATPVATVGVMAAMAHAATVEAVMAATGVMATIPITTQPITTWVQRAGMGRMHPFIIIRMPPHITH